MIKTRLGFNRMFIGVLFFSMILLFSQFVLLGQTEEPGKPDKPSIEKIKKSGKLVVGTSADYPPYEFHLLNDKDSELVGIDIDIAKAIAKELGVELEIKDLIFSKIFSALDSDKIDIAIAGLHPTEERKKVADFSEVYYQAIQMVVIRKSDLTNINSIEDLRGKRVGTQKDSIQESMARSQITGSIFVAMDDIRGLVDCLKKNEIDAIILEKPVAQSYVHTNDDLTTIKCSAFESMLGSAIAVKKGRGDLLNEINRILTKLKNDNKINEFVENAKVLTNKR